MTLEEARFITKSYFEFYTDHATTNVGTSKKLLSRHSSCPTSGQFAEYLKQQSLHGDTEITTRVKDLFPSWHLQIKIGINLALYGYGSKKSLLDEFLPMLSDYHVFRAKAYQKDFTFNGLLQSILENVYKVSSLHRRTKELSNEVCLGMDNEQQKILLVIEMADAPKIQRLEIWRTLERLSSVGIRLLLTFEHINAYLLNDWYGLRLAWHNATTLMPYGEELLHLLSNTMGSRKCNDETRLRGSKFALSNLTPTGRAVFAVLAEYQLVQMGTDTTQNMDEDEDKVIADEQACSMRLILWYQTCQDRFIVSNELSFRHQLTELLDHDLVKSVDDLGQHGTDFFVPFDRHQVEILIEIARNS